MRKDRATYLDRLTMLEIELNQQGRTSLTEDDINKIELARFSIKGYNEKIVAAKDWMGAPFDLEWVEFLDRVPTLKRLYLAAATDHPHPNIVAAPPPQSAAISGPGGGQG